MYGWLTAFAVLLGAVAFAGAACAAWDIWNGRRRPASGKNGGARTVRVTETAERQLRWTWADLSALALTGIGGLFLLVDAIAVIRDKDRFPFYHFGYLLSGFVFMAVAAAYLIVRLAAVLDALRADRTPRASGPVPGDEAEPSGSTDPETPLVRSGRNGQADGASGRR